MTPPWSRRLWSRHLALAEPGATVPSESHGDLSGREATRVVSSAAPLLAQAVGSATHMSEERLSDLPGHTQTAPGFNLGVLDSQSVDAPNSQ